MNRPFLLFVALVCSLLRVTAEEPVVRVQIIHTVSRVVMIPQGMWEVEDATRAVLSPGQALTVSASNNHVVLESTGAVLFDDSLLVLESLEASGQMKILSVPYGIGWWWEGRQDRYYEGTLRIRATPDGNLSVVVQLPLEQYLGGVVPYEIGTDAPLEALKAQTVAARSETVAALRDGRYHGPDFDLCADVECQVFAGVAQRTPEVKRAIRETHAIILTANGQPVGGYYASTCGGFTENVENIWPERSGPEPYWHAHPDGDTVIAGSLGDESTLRAWLASNPPAYCNPAAHSGLPASSAGYWRWNVVTPGDSLTAWVNAKAPIGRVLRVDSLVRGASGRILKASFVGERGSYRVQNQLAFRQLWTPPLRSSCVVIDTNAAGDFILHGAGWGHGVGMCQMGAIAMAQEGKSFGDILRFYFPTTELQPAF